MTWDEYVRLGRRVLAWLQAARPWMKWAGLALAVVAAGFGAHEWMWSHSEVHARAVVTQIEPRMDVKGDVRYFPHLRFRDEAGALVLATSRIGGEADDFHAGEVVPVMYKAGHPQEADLATRQVVYGVALAFGWPGAILFDLSVVLWMVEGINGAGMRMRIDELRNSGFGRGRPGSGR